MSMCVDLKVCRICLCKGVKLYNYDSYHLKQYYEEIMSRKVNKEDGLPNYFCYECGANLYKFHKFKEKCWMGEKALKELLSIGSITLISISQIDRQDKNLQSSIDITTVSKRVKTCIIKNKTLSKNLVKEINNDEISEIEKYVVEYDSDNSLDDKNLAEVNNEKINEQKKSIEDGKTNIDIGISTEEKAISDLEDNIMLSDDDDSNSENINNVNKPAIKEKISDDITIEEERINFNPELANSEDEIVLNKNRKEKRRNKNKAEIHVTDAKTKKFEVSNTKKNYLDPKHWLKINLTEEEALEEFRARAKDRKYVSAAYQCSDCYKGFSKEDMLIRHIKLRHSESVGPMVCRFCKMRFKVKFQLKGHITKHYTKFKCLRCDLISPQETTALLHNDYHNGVLRKCIHCGEEFRHQSTYYTHLRTHRSEYVCTLCGASFVSAKGLDKHKNTMHIDTVVYPEEGVTDTDTYCERCDIKFKTRKAYQEHKFHSAKHDVEDLVCETRPPLLAPSIPKRGKKFRKIFRKVTRCTICNKNFKNLTAYMKHHAEEHKGEPLPSEQRHICEICGASLAANNVAAHLNTHTREKLYTCSTCRMQFNTKSNMRRHLLTHTGEKPYGCSMCEKRFTQNGGLKLHYRTFHLKEPYPKRNRRRNAGVQQEDKRNAKKTMKNKNEKIKK